MKTVKVFKFAGFGILGIGAMFFFVWLVMLLWNTLVPELFNGPELSYWQTAGIFILSKILLSGFGGNGGRRGRYKGHHGHGYGKSKWKSKYHDKYHKEHCNCEEHKSDDEGKGDDVAPEVQPEK